METISEHGIVRTTSAANRIPAALFAHEEFKKFRTDGTANEMPNAKQIRHTTTEHKNNFVTTLETSQFNLMNFPFVGTLCKIRLFLAVPPIGSN